MPCIYFCLISMTHMYKNCYTTFFNCWLNKKNENTHKLNIYLKVKSPSYGKERLSCKTNVARLTCPWPFVVSTRRLPTPVLLDFMYSFPPLNTCPDLRSGMHIKFLDTDQDSSPKVIEVNSWWESQNVSITLSFNFPVGFHI